MFEYNGFLVKPIGPITKVSGGYVQRVRIVDCPDYIFDSEFYAVVKM